MKQTSFFFFFFIKKLIFGKAQGPRLFFMVCIRCNTAAFQNLTALHRALAETITLDLII